MAKKSQKKKGQDKLPEKIKYEETEKYEAFDRMMRSNKGILGPNSSFDSQGS